MKYILSILLLGVVATCEGQTPLQSVPTFSRMKTSCRLVLPSGTNIDCDSAWLLVQKAVLLDARIDSLTRIVSLLNGLIQDEGDGTSHDDPAHMKLVNADSNKYGFIGADLPAVDTAKVWLLVADGRRDSIETGGEWKVFRPSYSVPGYIAERKGYGQLGDSFGPWVVVDAYLDDKKRPLDSTLIVWQTKTRK